MSIRMVKVLKCLETCQTNSPRVFKLEWDRITSNILHRSYSSDIIGKYEETAKRAVEKPEEFWAEVGHGVTWHKPWDKVLDQSNSPFIKWFSGGQINACYNALDRHVDNNLGDVVALIHDSPVTQTIQKFTYSQMLQLVGSLSAGLRSLGVGNGDRVVIYMPMVPQAVVAMLACARLGAVHSLVFGGFAAVELSKRIKHAEPKVIITANVGVEATRTINYVPLVSQALQLSGNPKDVKCIVYQRKGYPAAELTKGRDLDWEDVTSKSTIPDCVPVDSNDPLYILYTSGTTGEPKGVQRPTGPHVAVLPWSLRIAYGIHPGDVWWAASDLGWVVGHSYICYGPLINGSTSVLFEGKPVGTPDPGQYFRVISDHKVKSMFVAPTALRAIQKEDPDIKCGRQYVDKHKLKYLFIAGEHVDNKTRRWAEKSFQAPGLDNWWQTETGTPMTAQCVGLGMNLNPPQQSSGKCFPGYQLKVVDENGKKCSPGQVGNIVSKLPTPPGFMSTLYKADNRFNNTYFQKFQGYYDTQDMGQQDSDGYIYIMTRSDDVIKTAGHRLSTSVIEEAIFSHPDVIDVAVMGVPDKTKGQVPMALFVIKPGSTKTELEISTDLVQLVRDNVGPVACFKLSAAVRALPRTRSGKTARKSISDWASQKDLLIPSTIEDATIYPEIGEALKRLGLLK